MLSNRRPYRGSYQWFKLYFVNKTDGVNNPRERSVETAIDVSMNYFFEEELEDNGVERMTLFVNAFLYAIEHGITRPDFTNEVERYVKCFETGEYDDLFKAEDLVLLYEDIAVIKKYLSKQQQM